MSAIIKFFLCIVISAKPDGFRRANMTLNRGENDNLILDENQIKQFEKDPSLSITIGEQVDKNGKPLKKPVKSKRESKINNQTAKVTTSLDSVTLDLKDAPEDLAPFIEAIHQLTCEVPLAKKPTCEQLIVKVPAELSDEDGVDHGEDELIDVKPNGEQRDNSWQWYQENVVNNKPG